MDRIRVLALLSLACVIGGCVTPPAPAPAVPLTPEGFAESYRDLGALTFVIDTCDFSPAQKEFAHHLAGRSIKAAPYVSGISVDAAGALFQTGTNGAQEVLSSRPGTREAWCGDAMQCVLLDVGSMEEASAIALGETREPPLDWPDASTLKCPE